MTRFQGSPGAFWPGGRESEAHACDDILSFVVVLGGDLGGVGLGGSWGGEWRRKTGRCR
jgi:hypothetical protein